MMESPEIYYEYNLKGKDEKQIMNEIDRLKNTIEKLLPVFSFFIG